MTQRTHSGQIATSVDFSTRLPTHTSALHWHHSDPAPLVTSFDNSQYKCVQDAHRFLSAVRLCYSSVSRVERVGRGVVNKMGQRHEGLYGGRNSGPLCEAEAVAVLVVCLSPLSDARGVNTTAGVQPLRGRGGRSTHNLRCAANTFAVDVVTCKYTDFAFSPSLPRCLH